MDDTTRRLDEHSARLGEVEKLVHSGQLAVESIRGEIRLLTQAVNGLAEKVAEAMSRQPGRAQKAEDAFIFWIVPIIGLGLLWVIKMSGQIPQGIAQ